MRNSSWRTRSLRSRRAIKDLAFIASIVMTTLLHTCERQIRYSHMLSQLLQDGLQQLSRLHLHGLWRHGTVRTSDSDVTTAVGCANDHLDSFAGSFRLKSGQTRTVKGRHDVAATVLASAVARLQGAGVDHHNELCRLRRRVCRHHVVDKSHDRRFPKFIFTCGYSRVRQTYLCVTRAERRLQVCKVHARDYMVISF